VSALDEIRELTRELRTGTTLYWSDLRALLGEREIAVVNTVLVDRIPDDDTDFLALVLQDDRVVEIEYVDRDSVPERTPRIAAWLEALPGTPEWSLYRERAELVLSRRDEL
jgi:hypothetical protein